MAIIDLQGLSLVTTFTSNKQPIVMKTLYEISSGATGTVVLKRRKIAKALRRWLRENEFAYHHRFFSA
jgi:hypothetical protein